MLNKVMKRTYNFSASSTYKIWLLSMLGKAINSACFFQGRGSGGVIPRVLFWWRLPTGAGLVASSHGCWSGGVFALVVVRWRLQTGAGPVASPTGWDKCWLTEHFCCAFHGNSHNCCVVLRGHCFPWKLGKVPWKGSSGSRQSHSSPWALPSADMSRLNLWIFICSRQHNSLSSQMVCYPFSDAIHLS